MADKALDKAMSVVDVEDDDNGSFDLVDAPKVSMNKDGQEPGPPGPLGQPDQNQRAVHVPPVPLGLPEQSQKAVHVFPCGEVYHWRLCKYRKPESITTRMSLAQAMDLKYRPCLACSNAEQNALDLKYFIQTAKRPAAMKRSAALTKRPADQS